VETTQVIAPSAVLPRLATRLLMLQRRLDDKQHPIQILREEPGRLRILCDFTVVLESVPA
jgi:hypothetical protein